MSNLLLRTLRAEGVLTEWALPFARAKSAAGAAERFNEKNPGSRTVMILDDAQNTGEYWLVSEADAQRLEARGYTRYVSKPEVDPDPNSGDLQ